MTWTVCPFSGKRGFVTEADALHQLRRAQGAARKQRQQGVHPTPGAPGVQRLQVR